MSIGKELEKLGFMSISSSKSPLNVYKCLPTGLKQLDKISARDINGNWGLPFGRQIEIAGKPDSGKTSLLLQIAGSAQKLGYDVVWYETERSLNKERAEILGVNDLNVLVPQYLEQACAHMIKAAKLLPEYGDENYKEDEGLVILFDSLAATPTKAEFSAEEDSSQVAEFARRMSAFQRRFLGVISARNVLVVYSNQLKEKIGVMFGKKSTTYGGNAVRYHCAQRFESTYTGKIKGTGGDVTGIKIKIENTKNKCQPPFQKIEGIQLSFEEGFDAIGAILDALIDMGIAKKIRANYTFNFSEDKMTKKAFKEKYETVEEFKVFIDNLVDGKEAEEEQKDNTN